MERSATRVADHQSSAMKTCGPCQESRGWAELRITRFPVGQSLHSLISLFGSQLNQNILRLAQCSGFG